MASLARQKWQMPSRESLGSGRSSLLGPPVDGAFSEAYGDYGYTLVLEADRTYLALHHQFDSVEAAIRDGVDIIPNVTNVRVFDKPQRTADTERGAELRTRIELLERLIEAYQNNELHQSSMDSSWPAESLP